MKKTLSMLLAVLLLFSLLCTMTIANAETTYDILDVKDNIRTVGRTETTETGIACDWTASGIEFCADVEGDISIKMTSSCQDVNNKGTYNRDCYFTVYIDGVRQSYRARTMNGTYNVTVAQSLPKGEHTIKVLKQNERSTTTVVMQDITMNGTFLAKPSDPEFIFECIGDSITSGFGSLDTNNQASRYSDGTRTYAFITAENFGAEARVTSQSGGTITGLYSQYIKNTRDNNDYDYSLKKPNVVTIAFGTNDGAKTVDYWQTGI